MGKHGTIAFITTPRFRESSPGHVQDFVYSHLYELCSHFSVKSTGGTGKDVLDIVARDPDDGARQKIQTCMDLADLTDHDLNRWRRTIREGLMVTMGGFQGMIEITNELVEGRLDAVIHLTCWEDKGAKPDTAVLSREANVHNVPIATDIRTASAHIRTWQMRLASKTPEGVFKRRDHPTPPPLEGLRLEDRVLAIIAHDNMKLETCEFAIEHSRHIFDNYDYVLATGTTGAWLKRFMHAAGRSAADVAKIRCCNSGPRGGDIQIACAVVRRICQKIIFFQDPSVSHAHDSDIRLFEQAVVECVDAELATNVESAKLIIGA